MQEQVLQERVALVYERSLDLSGLESPGTALAALVGYVKGPGDYRGEALGFGVGGAPLHPLPNTVLFNGEGQDGIQFVSAAGALGLSFVNTNIPLFRQPAIFPVSYQSRRTYVFESVLSVSALAATRATMGIHPTINDLNGSAGYGLEWSAGTGENGGNWTVRYRRTAAPTVIANVADSGVLANATPRRLAIVFRENDIRVDFYLDGVRVTTINDAVSIVGVPGNTVSNCLPVVATGAGAVGTTLNLLAMRLRVFDPDAALYPSDFNALYPV